MRSGSAILGAVKGTERKLNIEINGPKSVSNLFAVFRRDCREADFTTPNAVSTQRPARYGVYLAVAEEA